MRKHGLGAVVLSLALVLSSLSGFGFRVSAEEAGQEKVSAASVTGGDASVSGGNAEDPSVSGGNAGEEPSPVPTTEPVIKTPLDAPTGLAWGDNYMLHHNMVDGCKQYGIEYYKDGKYYGKTSYTTNVMTGIASLNFFLYELTESGTYKFRMRAIAAKDDAVHSNSEWSDWSEEKTYVRPDKQVGTTKVYWDTEKAGVVNFVTIDNADMYRINLYYNGSIKMGRYLTRTNVLTGQTISSDFSSYIAQYGAGEYQVQVKAVSADLDEYANGEWGPKSEVYDTTKDAAELKNILSDAMAEKSAVDAAETLKNSADISAVQTAMQTDDSFREKVKELEQKYAEEKGIKTSKAVSAEAEEYVDPGKVEIVGAAFNALENDVKLDMGLTLEEKKVPLLENYLNSVQLDIKLTSGSTEVHELEVPISITMPVPKGINAEQLVILHYHQDGTVERTSFHVNGDGTITFTVRAFSTFVFTGEDVGGDNSGNDNNGDGDNSGNDNNGGNDNSGNDNNGGNDNSGNDNNGGNDNSGNDNNGGNDNSGGNEENNDSEEEDGDEEDDNTPEISTQPRPVSPKTGAESPMTLYVVLAALCAALTVVFSIYKGKKSHK